MIVNKNITLNFIEVVARGLGELNEKSVFVGGSTVPFYLSSEMQAAARATEDVDLVLEILNLVHREKYEKLLREKGFKHDMTEGAPLCRWKFNELTVDIMSPNKSVFGFSNKWYSDGIKNSIVVSTGMVKVKILSLPYFLATKLEAFIDRGRNDFLGSPDMEDVIAIFDGAPSKLLEHQTVKLEKPVRDFLESSFSALLINQDFRDALPGSVFDRVNAKARALAVLERIENISKILGRPHV